MGPIPLIPIVPNGKRYWVLAPKQEQKTHQLGSLTLTETADKKAPPLQGRVVAVGDAMRHENYTTEGERGGVVVSKRQVKDTKYTHGDLVIFGAYAGNAHKWDGVDYLILHEDEILGHVVETPFDARDTTDLTKQ